MAVLASFRSCRQVFSHCAEQGLLSHFSAQASHCSGFSCCREQILGMRASVGVAYGLICPQGTRDLPRPGIESVSPASAGGFLTPGPPGKSETPQWCFYQCYFLQKACPTLKKTFPPSCSFSCLRGPQHWRCIHRGVP